jgi:hypothetical protein
MPIEKHPWPTAEEIAKAAREDAERKVQAEIARKAEVRKSRIYVFVILAAALAGLLWLAYGR